MILSNNIWNNSVLPYVKVLLPYSLLFLYSYPKINQSEQWIDLTAFWLAVEY
jgi:hypothetical protein